MQAYTFLASTLQQAHPADLLVEGNKLLPAAGCKDCSVGLLGRQDLAGSSHVLSVLESPKLAFLAAQLLQVCSVLLNKPF